MIQRAGSELEAYARILTKPLKKGNSSTKKSRYPTKFRSFLSDRLLVEELSFATVRARLIAYLVRLAEENGHRTPQGIHFQLTENNEQLAVRLGTVRELISRNLGRLHGDKLIEMNKRTVNIPDLAILRDEIGGSI